MMKRTAGMIIAAIYAAFAAMAFDYRCLPPDGMVIGYSDVSYIFKRPKFCEYISGEKEIQGKTYRCVWRVSNLFDKNPKIVAYFREYNGKVYQAFEDGTEFTAYDFTLEPSNAPAFDYHYYRYAHGNVRDYDIPICVMDRLEEVNFSEKRLMLVLNDKLCCIASGIGAIGSGSLSEPYTILRPFHPTMDDDPVLHKLMKADGSDYYKDVDFPAPDLEGKYELLVKEGRCFEYLCQGQSQTYRFGGKKELFGKEYHVLELYMMERQSWDTIGYMRQEGSQVFIRPANGYLQKPFSFTNFGEEVLIYDFNLKAGDSYSLDVYGWDGTDNNIEIRSTSLREYQGKKLRHIVTNSYEYLEGVGTISTGTVGFPAMPGEEIEKQGFATLLRVYDGDEVVYDHARFSGVEEIAVEADGEAEYFTLQGIRTDAKAPGIYLRRQGNKTEKIVVR